MEILVLNYEYPPIGGGASPVTKTTCEALAAKGHRLTIITMGYQKIPNQEEKDGIKIFRLPCWRSKSSVCYPWEQMTYIFSSFYFLRKHLKQKKYDVCHTHFIIPTGVIALWLKKHYNLSYVITSHGSDVPGYNQKRFKLLHKILRNPWQKICKNAKSIITPSTYLRDLIIKSCPVNNCEVIPNGIEIDIFKCGPKENIILAMSRLQPHKGVQKLFYAFSQIAPSDWTLHIAGDGPYRHELENIAKKLGISDRVIFHGWLKNQSADHINLLAKSKIFVSASDFESFGISVAEAIASDCQIIISNIATHQYFTQFGAKLFPLDDIDYLRTLLQQTMEAHTKTSPYKDALSINKTIDTVENILLTAKSNKQ